MFHGYELDKLADTEVKNVDGFLGEAIVKEEV